MSAARGRTNVLRQMYRVSCIGSELDTRYPIPDTTMMKRLLLYAILVLAVTLQLLLMTKLSWAPDLILVMVVFAGAFRGAADGLFVGLAAGVIRGLFSVDTLPIDIFLFPSIGVLSAGLARLFYPQNIANQLLITLLLVAAVISAHTVYFNISAKNDVGVLGTLLGSSWTVMTTVLISPFVFYSLKAFWKEED